MGLYTSNVVGIEVDIQKGSGELLLRDSDYIVFVFCLLSSSPGPPTVELIGRSPPCSFTSPCLIFKSHPARQRATLGFLLDHQVQILGRWVFLWILYGAI